MFAFQLLKMLPGKMLFLEGEQVGMIFLTAVGTIWALVPFLDREARQGRKSRYWTGFGIVVVLTIIGLTIMGYIVT